MVNIPMKKASQTLELRTPITDKKQVSSSHKSAHSNVKSRYSEHLQQQHPPSLPKSYMSVIQSTNLQLKEIVDQLDEINTLSSNKLHQQHQKQSI